MTEKLFPNVLDFCKEDKYLGEILKKEKINLYKKQSILLKMFYLNHFYHKYNSFSTEEKALIKILENKKYIKNFNKNSKYKNLICILGSKSGKNILSKIILFYELLMYFKTFKLDNIYNIYYVSKNDNESIFAADRVHYFIDNSDYFFYNTISYYKNSINLQNDYGAYARINFLNYSNLYYNTSLSDFNDNKNTHSLIIFDDYDYFDLHINEKCYFSNLFKCKKNKCLIFTSLNKNKNRSHVDQFKYEEKNTLYSKMPTWEIIDNINRNDLWKKMSKYMSKEKFNRIYGSI